MNDLSKIKKIAADAMLVKESSIAATRAIVDGNSFFNVAVLIMQAKRIATCGCGHSGFACMHFAHSLCCVEQPARFLSPSEALHGASGFLKPNDVMVFASRGGETEELYPIIDICKAKSVKIIGVTKMKNLD